MAAIAPIISAAGSALGGIGAVVGALSPQDSGGISWNDFHKQRMLGKTSRMDYADDFSEYAKRMGVSRFALLGHSMPSGGSLPTRGPGLSTGERIGSAMQRMGQDAQRGVQTYMAYRELTSQEKLREAQASKLTAEANLLTKELNNSQNPVTPALSGNLKPVPPEIPMSKNPQSGGFTHGALSANTFTRGANDLVRVRPSIEMGEVLEGQGVVSDAKDVLDDSVFQLRMANSSKFRGRIKAMMDSQLRAAGKMAHNESLVWNPYMISFQVMKDSERRRRTETKLESMERLKRWQNKYKDVIPKWMLR